MRHTHGDVHREKLLSQTGDELSGDAGWPAHPAPASSRGPARGRAGAISPGLEWIGGAMELPGSLGVRGVPLRRKFAVWLELPTRLVLAFEPVDPRSPRGGVARLLQVATADPLLGRPRVPGRIRVATPALARAVRRWVPPEVVIVVAPTPEVAEAAQALAAHCESAGGLDSRSGGSPRAWRELQPGPSPPVRRPAPGASRSYLLQGQVDPAITGRLFVGSQALYVLEPWRKGLGVLRVDIEQLGILGACMVVEGGVASAPQVLLYIDPAQAETAGRNASGIPRYLRLTAHLPRLVLRFEPRTAIPYGARREIDAHGWTVMSPRSYPWVESYGRDGQPQAVTVPEFVAVTVAVHALACVCWDRPEVLDTERHGPTAVAITTRWGPTVRLTLPYDRFDDFAPGPPV